MFAQDALAARYAKEAIEAGFDKQVMFPKRLFLYMPFEHGESAAMQQRSVELFEAAAADAPEVGHAGVGWATREAPARDSAAQPLTLHLRRPSRS